MANYNKKDNWVKSIRKSFDPETLADLIKKRIEFPFSTGPTTSYGEEPIDVITAIIKDNDADTRVKIESAVGLLLYKIIRNQIATSHEITRGVFNLIIDNRFTGCLTLVRDWLNENKDKLNLKVLNDKWNTTYRSGLLAFAYVQDRNQKNLADWWLESWRETSFPFLKEVYFKGLINHSPNLAALELENFVALGSDNTDSLLLTLWNEDHLSFEKSIIDGLDSGAQWAGLALNSLLGKLSDEDKKQLMCNLHCLYKLAS